MVMKELEILNTRLNKYKKERNLTEKVWELIAKYLIPSRETYFTAHDNKDQYGENVFAGDPMVALNLLVDGIYGNLCPPTSRWFKFYISVPDAIMMQDKALRGWLQDAENAVYDAFSRSNFYNEIPVYIADCAALGTSFMTILEDMKEKRPVYSTVHPLQCFIDEDSSHKTDTVIREFYLTGRQILQMFPDIDAKAKEEMKRKMLDAVKVFHFVGSGDEELDIDENSSIYWAEGLENPLSVGKYEDFPFAVCRWRRDSSDKYGRGPGHDAIFDIMGLNQIAKTTIVAAQLASQPPLNIPKELEGRVNYKPFGHNYYEDSSRQITPIVTGINYPIGVDQEQRKIEIVRKHFKTDFFIMLAQSDREKTATEILELQAEKVTVLGSTISSFIAEGLSPIIARTFDIEYRAGRIPEMPPQLQNYSGANIGVDYLGLLAQAQKAVVARNAHRTLSSLMPFFQYSPEAMDVIDMDAFVLYNLVAAGYPEVLIRDAKMVEQIRGERAQQQQQMQQMAMLESLGKTMKNVSPEQETAQELAGAMG